MEFVSHFLVLVSFQFRTWRCFPCWFCLLSSARRSDGAPESRDVTRHRPAVTQVESRRADPATVRQFPAPLQTPVFLEEALRKEHYHGTCLHQVRPKATREGTYSIRMSATNWRFVPSLLGVLLLLPPKPLSTLFRMKQL